MPRDADRDDGQRADVGVGLDDRREVGAALEHVVLVLVAAEDEIDLWHLLDQRLIAGDGKMGQRDQDVVLAADLIERLARGVNRRGVTDPGLSVGVDGQTDETDAHPAAGRRHRHDGGANRVGKQRAVAVSDIRSDELELRLGQTRA